MEAEKSGTYNYLSKTFSEEKIRSRYRFVAGKLQSYINNQQLNDCVRIDESLLENTIMSYFADISRIKEFHPINYANSIKRTAYMNYWILRNKPLQITNPNMPEKCLFVNEKFVTGMILCECFDNEPINFNDNLSLETKQVVEHFAEYILYYLKYRNYNAQILELSLESFKTGLKLFG